MKEEREYKGRLYGSLSDVGSDLIIFATLVFRIYLIIIRIMYVHRNFIYLKRLKNRLIASRRNILYVYGNITTIRKLLDK